MELYSNNFSNLPSDEEIQDLMKKLEEKGEQKRNNWSVLYQNKLTNR